MNPIESTDATRDLDACGGGLLTAANLPARQSDDDALASIARLLDVEASTVQTVANRDTALTAAANLARLQTGRERVEHLPATAGLDQLDGEPLAACVVEPIDAARLRALRARADRDGFLLIADESRTACRIAPGLAHRAFGVEVDLICAGNNLVKSEPFALLIGAAPQADLQAPVAAATQTAAALAAHLTASPVADELASAGERIRAAFDQSCAREDIDAKLVGPPALMRFEFAGQENAEAPLMAHHFGLELQRTGVHGGHGDVLVHPALDLSAVIDGIDRAVARMRCLLIEHNSYLCGEVPFVFPDADPRVADRGVALYRYPKLGPVEVTPSGDAMRIHFLGGEMGEVTSSGFYLPTLFTGDFDVSCRYEVHAWEPGPDSACLALFAQNLASSARYYAQRMSDGTAPDAHRVLGSLATVLSETKPVAARGGHFRITRAGCELRAWHREHADDEWDLLATDADATRDDVVFGVKIWSKVEAGRIESTIHELRIDAEFAAEQIPRLEHRPDPRAELVGD